jgi:hypothetical protein
MTSQREIEGLLADFLDEGPTQVADRVIENALATIDNNGAARPARRLRRLTSMNTFTRLAAAAVFGLLAVGVFAYLSRPPVDIGTTPTPVNASPSQGAVAPSPSGSTVPATVAPTAPPALPGTVIAYTRMTDKPRVDEFGNTNPACRFSEEPTCPVERIWIVAVDGSYSHELLPDGIQPQQLLGWSPDGNYLIYAEQGNRYVISVDGGEPVGFDFGCLDSCFDADPAFSNDGAQLAFVRTTNTVEESIADIATLDLATGQVVELISTAPKGGSFPNFSPDRRQIVFFRFGREAEGPFAEIKSAVFVVDAGGENLRRISPEDLDAEYPRWSPDGSRILFTSPAGFTPEGDPTADVYSMNPDGSDVRQLTTGGNATAASWTPDGRILFTQLGASVEAPAALWIMSGDGSAATELLSGEITGGVASVYYSPSVPLWRPIGGPAFVLPPWNPQVATLVGPPAPTPVPTPTPELGAGFTWTGSVEGKVRNHGVESATKLVDGRVLVLKTCDPVAQLYDPATGTFTTTGTMNVSRTFDAVTLLADGRVLISGGQACGEITGMLDSAEIYDPATGQFSATGRMVDVRQMHQAVLLADGRVLVAGGLTDHDVASTDFVLAATGANALKSAEIYDPVTGTFTATGSMADVRHQFTATLLLDGRVLVLGGGGEGYAPRAAAELYDPATGTFAKTGSMARARRLHSATLLVDGRVLICGGRSPGDTTIAAAEVYDPASGRFQEVGSLAEARQQQSAIRLADGRVIIAGGWAQTPETYTILASTEFFDPASGQFSSGPSMGAPRDRAGIALLNDGRVLIVGGTGIGIEEFEALASAVIYAP